MDDPGRPRFEELIPGQVFVRPQQDPRWRGRRDLLADRRPELLAVAQLALIIGLILLVMAGASFIYL